MPNFSVPLSGLDANSAALATTANNLANLNTVGYKDQQMQFADLFYQNLGTDGAGDPIQQGAGVQVSSQTTDFTQGDVSATGIDTDVAINGNGFFVVEENGVQSYTRAGNFEIGTNNLLETAGGQTVMGYPCHRWRRQYQRGTEHARTRSRNQQSRHRHRQPTDDHQPQCHRGRWLDLFHHKPPSTIPSAPLTNSR
jgi:flagellar hook-basal body protein